MHKENSPPGWVDCFFMELLGSNQAALGAQTGINAMMSIAMIALGIGVGTFTYRLIFRSRRVKSGA